MRGADSGLDARALAPRTRVAVPGRVHRAVKTIHEFDGSVAILTGGPRRIPPVAERQDARHRFDRVDQRSLPLSLGSSTGGPIAGWLRWGRSNRRWRRSPPQPGERLVGSAIGLAWAGGTRSTPAARAAGGIVERPEAMAGLRKRCRDHGR